MAAKCYYLAMSLEEIKTELAEMPQDQQDHLAAYLTHLRHQRDASIRHEIRHGTTTETLPVGELKEKWKD